MNSKNKDFDTVKTFREIKDKISSMSFEQIKEYLKAKSQKLQAENIQN